MIQRSRGIPVVDAAIIKCVREHGTCLVQNLMKLFEHFRLQVYRLVPLYRRVALARSLESCLDPKSVTLHMCKDYKRVISTFQMHKGEGHAKDTP